MSTQPAPSRQLDTFYLWEYIHETTAAKKAESKESRVINLHATLLKSSDLLQAELRNEPMELVTTCCHV